MFNTTVHQLDENGFCYREFTFADADEVALASRYKRIEAGYKMSATMVTQNGAYAFGAFGVHASPEARAEAVAHTDVVALTAEVERLRQALAAATKRELAEGARMSQLEKRNLELEAELAGRDVHPVRVAGDDACGWDWGCDECGSEGAGYETKEEAVAVASAHGALTVS